MGGSRVIRVVQVGTVPTGAELLSFLMPKIASGGLVVDDNAFRPSQLMVDPDNHNKLWFDISPWAGKEIELGFRTLGD